VEAIECELARFEYCHIWDVVVQLVNVSSGPAQLKLGVLLAVVHDGAADLQAHSTPYTELELSMGVH
jgi:hypothetical protein